MKDMVVVWNGAHHGCNADLLCIGEPTVEPETFIDITPMTDDASRWHSRAKERARVLILLAERESWTMRELRQYAGMTRIVMNSVLQGLRREQLIRNVAYGVVALKKEQAV